MVKDYTITDADTAAAVASEMNAYLRSIDDLEALRKKHIAPGLQVIQNAKDLFDPAINGLVKAKDFCKNLLSGWDVKERARIALENAKREETARKLRQEAEAKAAAERARAEQEAAEKRRKAEEAAAAGNAARAAKLQEEARAAVETGAARAQDAILQAAASAAAAPPIVQEKVAGSQMRSNFVAVLLPNTTEEQAKAMIVEAIVKGRSDLLGLLDLNTGAINKLAKALRTAMNVPGYEAVDRPIVAGQRR
jgi:hypothetical protein